MKKSTKMVGIAVAGGILLLATATFAGNVTSYCNYGNGNMYDSNWARGQSVQGNSMTDTCPWYKRWFGLHNDNCS